MGRSPWLAGAWDSVKVLALLASLVVCGVALAGCSQKETTPTPSTSPTVSTRASTSTSTSTSPTNATTTPSGPQTAFKGTIKWGSPNEQKTMTVAAGATSLRVNAQVNTTSAGAYSLSGAGPNEKPYLELKPSTGASTKIEFTSASGVATAGPPNVFGAQEVNIPNPPTGSWTLTVVGTGTNVHAYVTVVESFS